MGSGDYINQQREAEIRDSIETDRSSWIDWFASGIGAIGVGAILLKKRIASGDALLSNVFSLLGLPQSVGVYSDAAANVGRSAARSGTSGLRSVLNATYDVSKNRVALGPIDIIDDLRNSVELIANTEKAVGDHIAERTVEFTNRELVGRGVGTGYFTQGLQRVTFGQVMEDQAAWSAVMGSNQIGVISKAKQLGLITDSMILDKNIFFNKNTKEVLDFRIRNLFSKVISSGPQNNPIFSRVARFDMFGQGDVLASIFGLSGRNIGMLGPTPDYNGTRIFINGNVYGYTFNKNTNVSKEILLATNRSLRKTGDLLEVISASRQGRLEINTPARSGIIGSAISWMENTLGVGPAFSTRPSFVERWVLNPIKRGRALSSGEGVILRHPFRSEFSVNKVMDAALGGDIPELFRAGGHAIPLPGGGEMVTLRNLEGRSRLLIPNRVGVLFDLADDLSVVKTASYINRNRTALVSSDLVVPVKQGGYTIHGKNVSPRSPAFMMSDVDSGELTALGYKSVSKRYSYYDVGKKEGLKDFFSYAIYRLNSLASESLLGIGFRPDHRILPNMARVATIPVMYEALRQGYNYLDYISERVTGISPTKVGASIYAGARVLQQGIREAVGLAPAMRFLEKYFPGSINSDGAVVGRSIVAPIMAAGMAMKSGKIMPGLIAAASTFGLIGGASPEQSPGALIDEYKGETKVPVRKGRGWGLGYLPFLGGKPDRFENSWYSKIMSDYRTKSIYGSESEYWSYHANVFGIPFPTPSNAFGLLNILNPYRLEELNYYNRPYPQTSSPLETFPVIGPVLGATVGRLLKPTTYRQPTELPLREMALAPRGLTPSTAMLLGMSKGDATAYEAEDPASALSTLAKQANIASEPLGIYKFVMEFFGVKMTPEIGSKYATSNTMGDVGRAFYDLEIGGALGQTEFIRRFLLSDYSSAYRRGADINPIRNNLPSWLPGAYAENARDRSYFIDFTLGDPYSKIADGEARLPGPGYEALNRLHSGMSGVYSDVDKFLILSDVAPYSAAYRKYERIVKSMELSEEWEEKVAAAISNRNQVVGVDTRYKRYEEDIINLNLGTIENSIYAPIRRGYDFLTHDILAEIPYVGSKFFPFRNPQEQYRKLYVEGSEYASWDRPWEDIVRPALYDMALEDPATAAGKGAVMGLLMSGPMRWFTPIKSIIGHAGGGLYNPSAVVGGAIIGAGLSTARIGSLNSQNMIPYHLREEDDLIQYSDAISYLKNRLNGTNEPTMLGAKSVKAYRSALPRSADRRYFDYFASIEDEDMRQDIIGGLQDYMQVGLNAAWTNNLISQEESEQIALNLINNQPIPSSDWEGWSPNISSAATRLKFIEHGVNGVSDNIHRFGFYESHEIDLKYRLRSFNDQEINYIQSPNYGSFDQFTKAYGKEAKTISRFSTPRASRREVVVRKDNFNKKDIRDRIK